MLIVSTEEGSQGPKITRNYPEVNKNQQIDQQKVCMIVSGNNQILVMVDYFTNNAEAVLCATSSAEKSSLF